MSLQASDLASLIKSNLNGVADAATANQKLGDTLSSYILANADFTFTWTAVQTTPPPSGPPIPDPVITANGKFATLTITMSPSGLSDPTAAKDATKNQIISGMASATYNITDLGFSTTPGNMSTSSTLNTLDLQIGVTNQQDVALLDLSTKIINWVKQLAPSGVCSGTRTILPAGTPIYTGSGIVSAIS